MDSYRTALTQTIISIMYSHFMYRHKSNQGFICLDS